MAVSSFHAEKPTQHSEEHMNRKSKVTYLVDHSSVRNEYWENKKLPSPEEFVKLAPAPYTKRVNQKMQKSQLNALVKEAVVNLNEHHTLKDVRRMMFVAGKILGGYIPFRISVHKDEGVFVEYSGKLKEEWSPDDYIYNSKNFKWYEKDKDGEAGKEITNIISYRPSRDYHYNNIVQEWYEDKAFTKKADLGNKHIYYNYHAHVLYSPFDLNTGKGRSTREDMRSLQTLVANSLQMQRGQRFSNTKRKNHWQIKAESDLLNDEKRQHQKTKQKSNDLAHENSINKNQVWFKERVLKDLRDDFEKHQTEIESFKTLIKEQKRLKELLSCGGDVTIEEGIQKLKEETEKTIDKLKAEIEEKSKNIKNQSNVYESKISKLEKKVEELTEDVYSDRHIYLKGKKITFKYKYKNLVSGKEKTIEKQKTTIKKLEGEVEIFKKQLQSTGYEIVGASVPKAVNDYVEKMEEKYNQKIGKLMDISYTGDKITHDSTIEDETWKDRAKQEESKVSGLEIKINEQNEEIKELKELKKTIKDLEKDKNLLTEDIELLDKLAFYEKDMYIDKLDDYVTDKFSYKSENKDLQKELKARESELELANKVLKTVHEYKVPSKNLNGDIREMADKVLDKEWPKRIDEVQVEDQSLIKNRNDTEFTELSDENKDVHETRIKK